MQLLPSAADWWRRGLWVVCSPVFLHASVSYAVLNHIPAPSPAWSYYITTKRSTCDASPAAGMLKNHLRGWNFKSKYSFHCRSFHFTRAVFILISFHFSSVCPPLFRDSGGPQLLGGGANLQSNRKTGKHSGGGFDCSWVLMIVRKKRRMNSVFWISLTANFKSVKPK